MDEGETGEGGFGLTLTVFAPVQASRRASKHARPGFQVVSSRMARRRLVRLISREQWTAVPTSSGESKRNGEEAEVGSAPGSMSSSSSERSEVHSRRG